MRRPWRPRLFAALLSVLAPLLVVGTPARAQVSVQVGVEIGSYPRLARVPGYPVYYSPDAPANLFFYDGVYWLYVDDVWYTSSWYNGPWFLVEPFAVPVYVLRVPVRYYPVPPPYFRRWRPEAPPRWDEHWGSEWAQRRRGWDHWDRRQTPPPAPLPVYQRQYGGERYPASPDEQRRLQQQQYRYHPREPVAKAYLAPPPAQPPRMAEPRVVEPRVVEPPTARPVPQAPPRAAPPTAVQPPAPRAPAVPPEIEHRRQGLQRPVAPPPQALPAPRPPQEGARLHGPPPGVQREAPHEPPHGGPGGPGGAHGRGPEQREERGRER